MRRLIRCLSLIGLVSIVFLLSVYSSITRNYSKIANEIYMDVESMSALNQSLYQHQTLVFEHILTTNESKKINIEYSADLLEKRMRLLLSQFGETATGSKYETYYHSIYSGIVGYIKNIDIIFDFSRSGEIETAKYYMDNTLEDYIVSVNQTMKTMDQITRQDMQSAKEEMKRDTEFVRVSSYVLLAVLAFISVLSQILGRRVSHMMVNVDGLTGIINYSHFMERLERRQRRRTLVGYALLSINIKGFQYINQRIGTENGDTVLSKYANLLKSKISKNELIGRASGDGFVVLIQKEKVEEYLAFLRTIDIDVVIESIEDGLENSRHICIGVPSRCGYYFIESGVSYQSALENAALALKISRNAGENNQVCYDALMMEKKIIQTQAIQEFKSAIENREFNVFYQPKVDMGENRLCGAEALVRWFHNDQVIPPCNFVPALEQEGYIVDLDFYVFEEVCKTIRQWEQLGYTLVPISTNFSKIHLKNKRFAERVLDIVEKYQVDGRYLEIELTESVGHEDYESLSNFISKMKSSNISISIDDFGTGYSSLSMMKNLDVDIVKLDKSFIDGIENEKESAETEKLIANIVRMINDLHKKVICEGVETFRQAEYLRSVKCMLVQGYLFDRPLPTDEFVKRLIHPNY